MNEHSRGIKRKIAHRLFDFLLKNLPDDPLVCQCVKLLVEIYSAEFASRGPRKLLLQPDFTVNVRDNDVYSEGGFHHREGVEVHTWISHIIVLTLSEDTYECSS